MKQLPSSTLNLSSVWARFRKIRRILSHHHRKKRTSSVFFLQLLVHNLPRLPNQALQRFPNQALQVKRALRREKKQKQLSLNCGLKPQDLGLGRSHSGEARSGSIYPRLCGGWLAEIEYATRDDMDRSGFVFDSKRMAFEILASSMTGNAEDHPS